MSKNNFWRIVLIMSLGFFYASCSDSEDPQPDGDEEEEVIDDDTEVVEDVEKKVTLKGGVIPLGSTSGRTESVSISSFYVNVTDVAFVIDETDERFATEETFASDELSGPFVLDLLAGDFSLAGVDVPVGVYDEMTFNVSPSENTNSDLNGKSMLMTGTIGETPFTFFVESEKSMAINFSKNGGDLVVSESGYVVEINFDLDAMFGANGAIDLSAARDRNFDDQIDIYPGDGDSNDGIAAKIINAFEKNTGLTEDGDLDEDGIGNSEDEDIDGDGVNNDEDEDDDNDGVNDTEDADADGSGTDDDQEDAGTDETDEDNSEEDTASDEIEAAITGRDWIISVYELDGNDMLAPYVQGGDFSVFLGGNANNDSLTVVYNGQWEIGIWESITSTDPNILIFDFKYNNLLPGLNGAWDIIAISEQQLELEGLFNGDKKVCTLSAPQP